MPRVNFCEGQLSIEEIANAMAVSRRTVFRYLDT
ncbi:MAG: HTH domain-containing protein [Desulforhopalus sp.]|nr:HTH domain-containing protein [Desulforhopalus sp.]